MVHNKRAKFSRQRGNHTHGWGSKKKHRGSGHRGGKGNAGSGKKADQKKPSFWGIKDFQGKHGFHSHSQALPQTPINLDDLQLRMNTLVIQGKAKKQGDSYEINLNELGYNKLLSSGNVAHKLKITVDHASSKAVLKVQEKGGEVTVLKVKEEKEDKKDKKEKKSEKE
jgi:large subunit ribosomal protein L15